MWVCILESGQQATIMNPGVAARQMNTQSRSTGVVLWPTVAEGVQHALFLLQTHSPCRLQWELTKTHVAKLTIPSLNRSHSFHAKLHVSLALLLSHMLSTLRLHFQKSFVFVFVFLQKPCKFSVKN